MPANYAFHRFGGDALRMLPGATQQSVQRFRRLYNGGLHGSDLLFYFSPMAPSAVGRIRDSFSGVTGEAFFTDAARWLKQNPSEGGTACLYGLLARYCLRCQLAPLFREATAGGDVHPVELEVELDRYLLGIDGKIPAHRQDLSANLKMTRGECATLAGFYPPVTAENMWAALKRMTRWTRWLSGKRKGLARFLLMLCRKDFRHQKMPDHANHKCLHLDKPMLECYERALEMYPEMAQRLTLFLKNGTPLGEDFAYPMA